VVLEHLKDELVVSYAQNAEDVRLWRLLASQRDGFYVDIGAGDPTRGSVTRLFYDHGWSGVNVEPGPSFDALARARPRDVNLRIAIAEPEGESSFSLRSDLGMSTLDLSTHGHLRHVVNEVTEISIPTARLDTVLRSHARARPIQFLKIGVGGAERQVLASCDWREFRPLVVVVKAVASWGKAPTHDVWEAILRDAGYLFAAFDGINRFYLPDEHQDLVETLSYPISPLDQWEPTALVEERERAKEANARIRRLESEPRDASAREYELELQSRQLTERNAKLEQRLREMLASRTWRTGRLIARTAAPVQRLVRHASGLARRDRRAVLARRDGRAAGTVFERATAPGRPWHFPTSDTTGATGDRLEPLAEIFARSAVPIEGRCRDGVLVELAGLDPYGDKNLLDGRLTWEARQALLEVDAVLQIPGRTTFSPTLRRSREHKTPRVVVDARCLQDTRLAHRGVGRHAIAVVQAIRAAARGFSMSALTSSELPPLDSSLVRFFDDIAPTPTQADGAALFVSLSPMTASCASVAPFLCDPFCPTIAVIYDFIPTRYPAAYLPSCTERLANRSRLEALALYDVFLPISNAVLDDARMLLGSEQHAIVTGVADPLGGVGQRSSERGAYLFVPAGGDARKNIPAAVAAASSARSKTGWLPIVVTGSITPAQEAALERLAHELGMPDGDLVCLGYIPDDELADLYDGAAAVLVTSHAEGFSIPAAEAVLRGKPVVASDIAAHRELLGDGPWLAPPDDVDALSRSLTAVLATPEKVSAEQRAHVGDLADPERVRSRIVEALEPLLREARPTPPRRSRSGRPRLAVVSPLPPQRSGIADYTMYTFRHVAHYADVEFYSSGTVAPAERAKVSPISSSPYLQAQFDAVIAVVGDSHFHFPMLDLLGAFGGACISHDDRMVEAYCTDRGLRWTAGLLGSSGAPVDASEIEHFVSDLDALPACGYAQLAATASPLVVHSASLRTRVHAETGVEPVCVPFVPYNRPPGPLDAGRHALARGELGIADDVVALATFGAVDRRTKCTDLAVSCTSWLRDWGRKVHLYVVGALTSTEDAGLAELVRELDLGDIVTFTGHVPRSTLENYLCAVDAAVQLRSSRILTLSGSLADCIAYGVPTVTTSELFIEHDAPPAFVGEVRSPTSGLLAAEAVEGLLDVRRTTFAEVERSRLAYLEKRSGDGYARALLGALELAP
jgi:FkbM family methyltransferase